MVKARWWLGSWALLTVAWLGVACSDGGPTTTPSVDSVTVAPTDAVLQAGQAASFSAEVSGSDDARVVWQASCGAVEGSGATIDYRAPVTGEGRCTLTATSVASPGYSAVAEIEVTPVEVGIDAITFTPAHPTMLALDARVRVDWSWTSNIVGPYQVCALVAGNWPGCSPQDAPDGSATSEFWRADAGTVDAVQFVFQRGSEPSFDLATHVVPVAYEWREPTVELFAYVGTHAGLSVDPVTYVTTAVDGRSLSASADVEITIEGPGSWGTYEFTGATADNRLVVRDAVSGAYHVTAFADGKLYATSVIVDADLVLPSPTGETLVSSAVDELVVTWDPVPGAVYYEVQFNAEGVSVFYTDRSTTTSVDFARFDLDLDPTARHFLRVIAYSIDLTPGLFFGAELPPSQQRNIIIGSLVCFYPGDEAFSDCE